MKRKEWRQLIEKCEMLSFVENGDERGHLVVVEGNRDIPFEIKRVFYIYGSDRDVIRGRDRKSVV